MPYNLIRKVREFHKRNVFQACNFFVSSKRQFVVCIHKYIWLYHLLTCPYNMYVSHIWAWKCWHPHSSKFGEVLKSLLTHILELYLPKVSFWFSGLDMYLEYICDLNQLNEVIVVPWSFNQFWHPPKVHYSAYLRIYAIKYFLPKKWN